MMPLMKTAARTLLERYRPREPRRDNGTAEDICRGTARRCWNGTFYQTGTGHFDYFWARDFGVAAEALMALGHADRVRATLAWALGNYMRAGRVRACIDRRGAAFDAPGPTLDALPWLMRALAVSGGALAPDERAFLEAELARWARASLKAGLPAAGLAELRDAVIYDQSAYGICMLELLKRSARALSIPCPALARDYKAALEGYWNGAYFDADRETKAFSAECNLFPFWLGIIDDRDKLASVLRVIRDKRLSEPVAMRYTDEPRAFRYRWWARTLMRGYESATIWTWMGALYLDLLKRAGAPEHGEERAKFAAMIERIGAFPELLRADGSLYQTPFYRAERGMLWAALYLAHTTQ